MSDSWIFWKPAIEEPSKLRPSVKTSGPKEPAGTVKCCITPGRSQKRQSMVSMPSSLTKARSSSALVNMNPPVVL